MIITGIMDVLVVTVHKTKSMIQVGLHPLNIQPYAKFGTSQQLKYENMLSFAKTGVSILMNVHKSCFFHRAFQAISIKLQLGCVDYVIL